MRVLFPGATAEEVDETIIQRLEDALDGTRDLKEMRSVAQQSMGTTTLKMNDNGDYNAFRNEIDNSVSSIDDLPEDAEPPVITRLNTRQPVLDILVEGPMNAVSLKAYAETLRDQLTSHADISVVKHRWILRSPAAGGNSSEVKLLRYRLSPLEVSTTIASQSLDLPVGKIEGPETVRVRVEESRKSKLATGKPRRQGTQRWSRNQVERHRTGSR